MMKLNEFTLQIIFLALPGIICYFLLRKLVGRMTENNIEITFLIFLFSVVSYVLYNVGFMFSTWADWTDATVDDGGVRFSEITNISAFDILWSILAGIGLAFFLSYAYTYNFLNRFAQVIRASTKFGDEDVWHFFQNAPSDQKNHGWILVRDHKLDLIHYGSIDSWSDTEKERELLMSNVTVYSAGESVEELYETDSIYVCRDRYELTLEVPKRSSNVEEA